MGVQKEQAGSPLSTAVLITSGGFVTSFVVLALIDLELVSSLVGNGARLASDLFGAFWQVLLLATFVVSLAITASRAGSVRLGGLPEPEMSTFKWIAVIMCTLLAGGGVFWAAAEPMAHFVSPPPWRGLDSGTRDAAVAALSQSFMHWGFLAWSILGSLTAIVMMRLHYEQGLPLQPRTLLYPVLGEKVMHGWPGVLVDVACVVSVIAGTVGPIGFLGLQVAHGLSRLTGIADGFSLQLSIILGLIAVYTISAISGITRGIQLLSRINIFLALGLMSYILILGPTAFIFDSYIQAFGDYLHNFIPMATYRGDTDWLGSWTVFFWGWFLGYGPMMAMFVARISRGRTIRELVVAISLVAPVVTCFWFTIVGGTGIAFELADPGVISGPFGEGSLPAALLAITAELPYGVVVSVLFLVLTTIFVATTGDSMTYTISMVVAGHDDPSALQRVFWGIMMGALAAILISIGAGGVSALQSFIVITAVPVSLVLLPSLWCAPRIAAEMLREQGPA
jgi:choline/carnitine/betaine transport